MHSDREPLDVDCRELQRKLKDGGVAVFALTETETHHMNACEACMLVLLDSALGEKPAVRIPDDFARRVSALAPVPIDSSMQAPAWGAIRQTSASRLAGICGFILLLIALAVLLLVPGRDLPAKGSVLLTFETLIAIEAAGLAWWLAGRGRT